jgi:hypothetical protein
VIRGRASATLEIDRIGLAPALLAELKHVSSLHNLEFYEKERGRRWTGNTPRFIRCYQETVDRILLPRGLREHAESIVTKAGSTLEGAHLGLDKKRVGIFAARRKASGVVDIAWPRDSPGGRISRRPPRRTA